MWKLGLISLLFFSRFTFEVYTCTIFAAMSSKGCTDLFHSIWYRVGELIHVVDGINIEDISLYTRRGMLSGKVCQL